MHFKRIIPLGIAFAFCVCFSLAQEEFPFFVKIGPKGANLRTDSTVSSEVIIELNKDDIVQVKGVLYDWYKVDLPDLAPCYVFSGYVKTPDNKTGFITADNVNIRLGPDKKSKILGKLSKGASVNIVALEGEWYKIHPDKSLYGWIHKSTATPLSKEIARQQPFLADGGITVVLDPEQEDTFAVEGVLQDKGKPSRLFKKKIPYKLVTAEGKIYLLEGNETLLAKYANYKVKVVGNISKVDKAIEKYPVLVIKHIERVN